MRFHVQLDIFAGPLDLLLYLVRRHEVEITEVPLATVTEQYLESLAVLEQLDIDGVGEFVEVASTLIEIKSRQVLPQPEEEATEVEDPRRELVQRLLEYKEYRDAAHMLEERGRQWSDQFPRLASELPSQRVDPQDQPIHEAELWDLVSAFGRIMRQREPAESETHIRYDDTPIHVFMQRIHERLLAEQRVGFTRLFEGLEHRSTYVSSFLAILELLRHHHALAAQDDLFGEIWLKPGAAPLSARLISSAPYDHAQPTGDDATA